MCRHLFCPTPFFWSSAVYLQLKWRSLTRTPHWNSTRKHLSLLSFETLGNITDKKPPNWWPSSRVQNTWHRLCHDFRLQGEVDTSFCTRRPLPRCTCIILLYSISHITPSPLLLLLPSPLLLLPLSPLPSHLPLLPSPFLFLFFFFTSLFIPSFSPSSLPPAVCPRVWGTVGWWLQGRLPLFTHQSNGTGGEKERPVKPVCPAQWDSPCSGARHTRVWGPCEMPRWSGWLTWLLTYTCILWPLYFDLHRIDSFWQATAG